MRNEKRQESGTRDERQKTREEKEGEKLKAQKE
jgi:hypothetical protein